MSAYVELFASSEPHFLHSEPVTSRNTESAIIADMRAEIAAGTLSGTGLTLLVVDHIEPLCECDGPTIVEPCKVLREEGVKEFSVSELSPYADYVVTLKDGRKITAHTTGMLAELIDDPGYLVNLDEVASIREVGEVA